ncbi:hypothetical protein [Streptomyces sp. CRN 30]|uniref:hypothetical protein n=1 Tax=Streptomyces sp. CRN 30 TaxID=3075613 RepID=UPI002A7F1C0C|nr:hypothetical protein [Streptomyces sp. CRN 30]
MTQPPGPPPQDDGYELQPPQPPQQQQAQQPQQPPYPGSYGQSPQPQQPYGAPVPPPYPGQAPPPYGAPYGSYPPPPAPPGDGGARKKTALIVAAAAVIVAVCGVGIFLATGSGGDDGERTAGGSVSAAPSVTAGESEAAAGLPSPSVEESDEEPYGLGSGGASDDEAGDKAGDAPAEPAVEGQWQDAEIRTLTVGSKYESGDMKDKYALSYIDIAGGKGILTGLGAYRDDDSFRMALKPMGTASTDDSDLIYGTVRRDGDDVVISWDEGGSDTLEYIGAVP